MQFTNFIICEHIFFLWNFWLYYNKFTTSIVKSKFFMYMYIFFLEYLSLLPVLYFFFYLQGPIIWGLLRKKMDWWMNASMWQPRPCLVIGSWVPRSRTLFDSPAHPEQHLAPSCIDSGQQSTVFAAREKVHHLLYKQLCQDCFLF